MASPCEADLDVGGDNYVTDGAVDANHTDEVIDDHHDVDPDSMEVDNHVVSQVCVSFYVLSKL